MASLAILRGATRHPRKISPPDRTRHPPPNHPEYAPNPSQRIRAGRPNKSA